MDDSIAKDWVPGQYTGNQTETLKHVVLDDEESAKQLFALARAKLLDINRWHSLCGFLSPAFQMTDLAGVPVNRLPELNDYIRIDIPGPGTQVGRGYDWVMIERLTHIQLDPNQELFFMQVRPAAYPGSEKDEVAHFYKNSATSSFMLVRELRQVTAAIYGRNEVPNTETENMIDKIRNQVIGSSGAIGLSVMQWRSLVASVLNVKG